jgi:hypothetical protein
MAERLLFHHAQGLTAGCLSFADELRAAGHVVHAPDLYDGKTFTELTDGVAYAEQVGFETIIERGRLAAESLPNDIVYAGFSLGGCRRRCWPRRVPARRAPMLLHASVPTSEFGRPWPTASRSRSTRWRPTTGATSTSPASSPRRSRARSCSCTPAIDTCSLTTASRLRRKRRDPAQATRAQLPRQHRVAATAHRRMTCSLIPHRSQKGAA